MLKPIPEPTREEKLNALLTRHDDVVARWMKQGTPTQITGTMDTSVCG
jgi:hypothetical protein